jgi:hypothetical protein
MPINNNLPASDYTA